MIHIKFDNIPVGTEFTSLSYCGTFIKINEDIATRDVAGMHSHIGFFPYELVMLPADAEEPQMPSQSNYLDSMGYVDYDAYDVAFGLYEATHSAWYESYGRRQDQIARSHSARIERSLTAV